MTRNRTHPDRIPPTPTAAHLDAYHDRREAARRQLGLTYRTGPRHGQQLAVARVLALLAQASQAS